MSTKIEWATEVWNPVTGCTKTSEGCRHCYAERMAIRLRGMGQPKYERGFLPTCHESELYQPLSWRKPRIVFVCSMSDLFHDAVPSAFIQKIFRVMHLTSRHTFLVLTKRAERMAGFRYDSTDGGIWPLNVWAGVTAENQERYDERTPKLVYDTPALVKWVSLEPLLGPISLRGSSDQIPHFDLDWVVVGGESGPGARALDPSWARSLRDQCLEYRIPFFFKQWGGVRRKQKGRLLDGREHNDRPVTATSCGRI